jgi:hypothetical protein
MFLAAAPAMAAHTKKDSANTANASASTCGARVTNHGWQTWANMNPECNGWADWLRRVEAGDNKLVTAPPGSLR